MELADALPPPRGAGLVGTVVRGESRCGLCDWPVGTRSIDRLTGLLDRSSWDDAATAALRAGQRAALLLIDLDSFKKINDEIGHPSGDLVLRSVADVLRFRTRRHDVLGRYGGHGGDEFLVLLPGFSESQAHAAAREIQAGIETIELTTAATPDTDVTITGLSASVGVAAFPAGQAPTLDALVLRADVALRAAKRRHHGRSPDELPRPTILDHDRFARRLVDLRSLLGTDSVPDVLHALSARPLRRSDLDSAESVNALTRLEREGLVRRPANSTYELTALGHALLDLFAALPTGERLTMKAKGNEW